MLPTIAQNRVIVIYFVSSSCVPLSPKPGRIKPRSIKKAIGIAEPTPFDVRALLTIAPRSSGFGVIRLGRLQKGTSLIE